MLVHQGTAESSLDMEFGTPTAKHTARAGATRPCKLTGRTRARIPAAAADPAAIDEAADRLRPSASTVPRHLQIPHQAGSVQRTRGVRSVLHQSTREAG